MLRLSVLAFGLTNLVSLVTAGCHCAAPPSSSSTSSSSTSPQPTTPPTIFSMGASYAQGPGLTRPIGRVIADNLNSRSGATTLYAFQNIAISGSLLESVYTGQAQQLAGQNVAAVYMNSGGNDLNYSACLILYTNGKFLDACRNPTLDRTTYITRYTNALNAIRDNTAHMNPLPPIYAVTYSQALGPSAGTYCNPSNPRCPFNSTQLTELENLYSLNTNYTLDAITRWQGANSGRTLIPIRMDVNSQGHQISTTFPWVNSAVVDCGGILWHPNDGGAIAVAGFINQTLGSALPL